MSLRTLVRIVLANLVVTCSCGAISAAALRGGAPPPAQVAAR